MYKRVLISFSLGYFLMAFLLLIKGGFWIVPSGFLTQSGENFFLPFVVIQMGFMYLISSTINSSIYQVRIMLVVFLMSFFLIMREIIDFIYVHSDFIFRPLTFLGIGQGLVSFAFLLQVLSQKEVLK
jgi:hypothetical protein